MSLEIATFGLLSKLYLNLKKNYTKTKVAKNFGIKQVVIFENWLHALANLRNIIAHHGRVWNRQFIISPKIPYNTIYPFLENTNIYRNKIYAQIL